MNQAYDILGVRINNTNLALACQQIEDWIKTKVKTYVCIAPVATIMDCQDDPEYREIVNNSGMNTPDGMPLVWCGKLKGQRQVGRTYGPDLMLRFCELSQEKGYRQYFYGGTERTGKLLTEKLSQRFPALKIVGHFSPPFRNIREREDPGVLAQINRTDPDVIWVGLGSPKQDYWMRDHRDLLNAPVMVGVGAAFDFLAGTKPQAPAWIRNSGLEWLFRLCCEPRRLWRRYLLGNTRFIYLLTKEFFRKGFGK